MSLEKTYKERQFSLEVETKKEKGKFTKSEGLRRERRDSGKELISHPERAFRNQNAIGGSQQITGAG